MKGLVFALFLMPLSFNAVSACKDGEVLSQSSNEVVVDEVADHVGFCQHHAARDLLHQEICKHAKNPKDCFQPAVMDFIALDATFEKEKEQYRNSEHTLDEILKRGSISNEKCFSLNEMFPHDKKKFTEYSDKFRNAIHKVVIKECVIESYKDQNPNAACGIDGLPDIDPAVEATLKTACELKHETGSMRSFMYSAIKRQKEIKNCPSFNIPRLKRKVTFYNQNGLGPSKNLMNILASGHQTIVVTDSPHALVVSNFKVVCRNGKEKLKLQVIDSLYGTQWSEAKKTLDWIDGDNLIQSLNPQADFQWLEAVP